MKTISNIERVINWLIILVLCSLTRFLFQGCSKYRTYESIEDKSFKRDLNEVLKIADKKLNENEKAIFRMDTLTKFGWDKMYAFGGYVTADSIENRTGVEWGFGDLVCIQSQDKVLIFMKGDSIVSTVKYPEWGRNFLSFSIGFTGQYVTPEKSAYCVYKQYDVEGNYNLVLISLDLMNADTWVRKRKLIALD